MNTPRWAKYFGVAAAVLLMAMAAVATPLKSPKRLVGQGTADLTPLFHWWTNHAGARPLTGWAHVTGKIVATNRYGWVVDARLETSKHEEQAEGSPTAKAGGNTRIILMHPPLQDRTAFEQLAAQLRTLEAQRTQATNREAQLHHSLHSNSNNMRTFASKGAAWERHDLDAAAKQAAAARKQLDKQIQEVRLRLAAWPSPDHYEVDCFALDTNTGLNRVPLYDHGTSWQ